MISDQGRDFPGSRPGIPENFVQPGFFSGRDFCRDPDGSRPDFCQSRSWIFDFPIANSYYQIHPLFSPGKIFCEGVCGVIAERIGVLLLLLGLKLN